MSLLFTPDFCNDDELQSQQVDDLMQADIKLGKIACLICSHQTNALVITRKGILKTFLC